MRSMLVSNPSHSAQSYTTNDRPLEKSRFTKTQRRKPIYMTTYEQERANEIAEAKATLAIVLDIVKALGRQPRQMTIQSARTINHVTQGLGSLAEEGWKVINPMCFAFTSRMDVRKRESSACQLTLTALTMRKAIASTCDGDSRKPISRSERRRISA